jgi:STE24 endopeptidase
VIAPLFNKFTPLADASLKERIEALLARCGFRASGLFVMDGSKRSAHGNAYFTGFGQAKRIVFFDTLLEKLGPAEIEAVLAHELGHYKRRHVWKRIARAGAGEPGLPLAARQADRPAVVLRGAGHDGARGTAAALVLFSLVSRCSPSRWRR